MMRPLIKVTLFDATSENDCTLLEEHGEYFVNFGNRTGTYREFLRMILRDDRDVNLMSLVPNETRTALSNTQRNVEAALC